MTVHVCIECNQQLHHDGTVWGYLLVKRQHLLQDHRAPARVPPARRSA